MHMHAPFRWVSKVVMTDAAGIEPPPPLPPSFLRSERRLSSGKREKGWSLITRGKLIRTLQKTARKNKRKRWVEIRDNNSTNQKSARTEKKTQQPTNSRHQRTRAYRRKEIWLTTTKNIAWHQEPHLPSNLTSSEPRESPIVPPSKASLHIVVVRGETTNRTRHMRITPRSYKRIIPVSYMYTRVRSSNNKRIKYHEYQQRSLQR